MARRFVIKEAPAHKVNIGSLHPGGFFVQADTYSKNIYLIITISDERDKVSAYSFEDQKIIVFESNSMVHPLTVKATFYKQPA